MPAPVLQRVAARHPGQRRGHLQRPGHACARAHLQDPQERVVRRQRTCHRRARRARRQRGDSRDGRAPRRALPVAELTWCRARARARAVSSRTAADVHGRGAHRCDLGSRRRPRRARLQDREPVAHAGRRRSRGEGPVVRPRSGRGAARPAAAPALRVPPARDRR